MDQFLVEKQVPYYEQFYQRIKQMIFDGKYQPGERINETQLAKQFSVSKSPVREAIRILEKEGLLEIKNTKLVVYEPTLKDVKDIYFCRMALESFAVDLTTRIATESQLDELGNLLLNTEKAIKSCKGSSTIIELNEQFHTLILQFTDNSRIQKQVNDLKGLIHYYRVLNFKGKNRAEDILGQHHDILYYIKNRDALSASNEMIKHLEKDIEHLVHVLTNDS
ncbi:GntR family transcriptional regulator [Bacillus fonticola]|uniref:GntR family transcriptional regulator n=1 Tax=Bacillus fonticola TaxID=2728853 RepID=UPI00147478EC|nr:GntR family transcriptional regulator [Bacillus fonticola]